jgi:hypothetical protein
VGLPQFIGIKGFVVVVGTKVFCGCIKNLTLSRLVSIFFPFDFGKKQFTLLVGMLSNV